MAQLPPAGPHAAMLGSAQRSPSQQPVRQDSALHTQRPLEQRCPGAHAASVPHRQAPPAPHESASIGSHATHVAPPIPHVLVDRARHSAPSQQPAGHDRESQTHRPTRHRWPAGQVGPSPQAHPPATSQWSARIMSQGTQRLPSTPQLAWLAGLQVAPEQHPSGHVLALQPLQTPPSHASPVGQALHSSPPLPHALA